MVAPGETKKAAVQFPDILKSYLHLFQYHRRSMIFGMLLTLFSSFGQTFFISISAPTLIETFGLSNARWGGLYSMATLISALCLPYVGGLLDKFSLRNFSAAVCLAFAFACLTLGAAQQVWMVFIAIVGLRLCGQGLLGLIASTTMARAFTKNRGTALSVSSTGFPLGEILFPPLAIMVLKGL
jgi:MFS family permease